MKHLLPLLVALSLVTMPGDGNAQDIIVKAGTLYPVGSAPIENGIVVIRDGKIQRVGKASSVRIPAGIKVVEAAVVTPGLIDAHSVVGLAGYLNQDHDQDQLESSEAIQPELRAIDAYNAREALVGWLRSFGVTTIHTGHAPGEIISGQTMIVKTSGDTVADALVRPVAMLASTIGDGARASGEARKSPGTRAKVVSMLRGELVKARDYVEKREAAARDDDKEAPPRNLRLEALAAVLAGDTPLLVTANRHNDIVTALRIAREFNINIVLDGAAESYLVIDEINAAGVSVILHATMVRAWGEQENASFTTARKLLDAGIPVTIQSGYESYVPKTRVVLFEAAVLLQHGLNFNEALSLITLDAAKILKLDDRVGSIERGKDGDLALFDGDPFEYTTRAVGTIINGKLVSDIKR
jgi:imidazolonepropionase-like amidohydrolase